jgi:hypothetical protein
LERHFFFLSPREKGSLSLLFLSSSCESVCVVGDREMKKYPPHNENY